MCFAPQRPAISRHRDFKIAPNLMCFVHFDLRMCVAPQRRAVFQIGTTKIAPKLRCFAYFDLQMCFAPQQRSFFRIGTSHSGVPFFNSPLSSYLCARRFSEPTFLNLRNHESLKKHATFLTFGGRAWSFFLDFLVTLLAC